MNSLYRPDNKTELRGIGGTFTHAEVGEFAIIAPNPESLAAIAKLFRLETDPKKNRRVVVTPAGERQ